MAGDSSAASTSCQGRRLARPLEGPIPAFARQLPGGGIDVEPAVVEAASVVDAIVELTEDAGGALVGATREGLVQLLFGAIPEQVGGCAHSTVIVATRHPGIASRLARWFGRRNGAPRRATRGKHV